MSAGADPHHFSKTSCPPAGGAVGIQALEGRVRWYAKGAYTIPEAGELFFGLGKAASYKAAEDGRLPRVKIGARRYVVTADAIDQMLHPDDYAEHGARCPGQTTASCQEAVR